MNVLKLTWNDGKAELRTTRRVLKNTMLFADNAIVFSTPNAQTSISKDTLLLRDSELVKHLRGQQYARFEASEMQKAEVARLARREMGPQFDLLPPVREQESAEKTDVSRVFNSAFPFIQGLIVSVIASYIVRKPIDSRPDVHNTYLVLRRNGDVNQLMGVSYENIPANTVLTINPAFFLLTDFLHFIKQSLFEMNTFYQGVYTMIPDITSEAAAFERAADRKEKLRAEELREARRKGSNEKDTKVASSLLKFMAVTPIDDYMEHIKRLFGATEVEAGTFEFSGPGRHTARKPKKSKKGSKK